MPNINQTLYTALITPLNNDSSLDIVSFKHLLQQQSDAGNGVVLLGSTGEGANLPLDIRKQVLEIACESFPDLAVIVGVGGIQLEETLSWLSYCETLAISAYLMVNPVYAKPGTHGQIAWFSALMDHVTKPCMLYNVPSRTSVAITTEAFQGLLGHKNFWAVKEASGDPQQFATWSQQFPELKWYSGDDLLIFEHVKTAAAGLISVASNIWPQQTADLVTALMQSNQPRIPIDTWKKASLSLFVASNPVPTKRYLAESGEIETNIMCLPLSPLDCPDISAIEQSSKEIAACLT